MHAAEDDRPLPLIRPHHQVYCRQRLPVERYRKGSCSGGVGGTNFSAPQVVFLRKSEGRARAGK